MPDHEPPSDAPDTGKSNAISPQRPVEVDATTQPLPKEQGPAPMTGEQIGPYTLRERLGAGGLGVVYLADQRHPVRRSVAVKFIKPGMDTEQVLARFEMEREALALMDHPHIARVLDSGAANDGRPYFVMEHVAGEPITLFSDEHQQTTDQRLTLFLQLCSAMQHAHQKGIIHRDIKPSNVLVSLHDLSPVVKVIDFGVAKALYATLTNETIHTQIGQPVGTWEYMSPEQAGHTRLAIDTRSDIYSLGVLLYELLTGVLPYDPSILKLQHRDEIRRRIREEVPPKPSTRISGHSQETAGIARNRHTDIRHLQRRLQGDLDWIVMKAMEKDPARRYASASELADDIRRHLADQPVLAGPPSTTYQLRKFVRRNRVSVSIGAAIGIGLVCAVGFGLYGWKQHELRDLADKNRVLAEEKLALEETINEQIETTAAQISTVAKQFIPMARNMLSSTTGAEPAAMLAAVAKFLNQMAYIDASSELLDLDFNQSGVNAALREVRSDVLIETIRAAFRTSGEVDFETDLEAIATILARMEDHLQTTAEEPAP